MADVPSVFILDGLPIVLGTYGRYYKPGYSLNERLPPSRSTPRYGLSDLYGDDSTAVRHLKCHDCSEEGCDKLIHYNWTGKCHSKDVGKCFVRQDPNDIVYRGCADTQKWPMLDYTYTGCRYQTYGWWDQVPVLWCFCDFDLCNANITFLLRRYKQSLPSYSEPRQRVRFPSYSDVIDDGITSQNMSLNRRKTLGPAWELFVKYLRKLQNATTADAVSVPRTPPPTAPSGNVGTQGGTTPSNDHQNVFRDIPDDQNDFLPEDLPGVTSTTANPVNMWDGGRLDIADCVDLQCDHICETLQGAASCRCHRGFDLADDQRTCQDVDECELGRSGCGQVCTNTRGSFYCSCSFGYKLDLDKRTCKDVDECQRPSDSGRCSHLCQNTPGSYLCSCPPGYRLDDDQHTCHDVNECRSEGGGDRCEQRCTNIAGSYICSCFLGYSLNADANTCSDMNECSLGLHGCQHTCLNTPGSYTCTCRSGFVIGADRHQCLDHNECQENNGNCQQLCVNTAGSYRCSCITGFTLNSDLRSCDDNDECLHDNGGCSQICSNTEGSFICSCNHGYKLDPYGRNCLDINECLIGNGGCEVQCVNLLGSHRCACHEGYTLNDDLHSCDGPQLYCEENNGGCGHVCQEGMSGAECSCRRGFVLSPDGHTCTDVNECAASNGGCQQLCNNTPASYVCQCRPGYQLSPDGFSCTVKCPLEFTRTRWGSCYKVYSAESEARTVHEALAVCHTFHPAAKLVTIDNDAEQAFIANHLSVYTVEMLDGWQGWWTGGIYNNSAGLFQWHNRTTVIPEDSSRWGFLQLPYEDTCVWVLQISQFEHKWGNYDCQTRTGFICEFDVADL